MNNWRLLLSGFNEPYTNMAIDEAIFIEHCLGNNPKTLRIYGWKPPSLSLGCFQNTKEEVDLIRCAKENIPYVRRMTGGGIIFHEHELTYSVVCSKHDLNTNNIKDSFRILCSFIICAFKELGLNPSFAKDINLSKEDPDYFSPFCFASNEEYDILVQGKKIGGNAQRRRKDIVFQHGSIPLRLDIDKAIHFLKKKPQIAKDKVSSLEDVLGKDVEFSYFQNLLIKSFKETFSVTLDKGDLTGEEEKLAHKLKEEKYSKTEWNLFRRRFSIYNE